MVLLLVELVPLTMVHALQLQHLALYTCIVPFKDDAAKYVNLKRKERVLENVHVPVSVSPVIPSSGIDDVVHVSVSKDDRRESAPCPAQVEGT
ncbi:hypothetical protein PanWU01x14_073540 [Parasponia andersonii]|uniref:Secreted protein n=1 Tax=Parasponia andersonii TaxID=3476 RepID=A0A2P5DE53_PARAD|nr:hypothetical protein PanWU01x14_073540 [Parasponia andersonii]